VVKPRSTHTTRAVLQALADADTPLYGRQIIEATDLYAGTVYPILNRLERVGWVAREDEDVDPKQAGRPARRFYSLTTEGRAHLPPRPS
jgi:PadR family transcriptional regulator, regulatory protein PadR